MSIKQTLNELYAINEFEVKLGLSNIKKLLKKLGNPEKKCRYIHVAGSNGKGSVCTILHSILSNTKLNVGLYTSPHLKKFNERIRINNKEISDKEIVALYKKVKKHVTTQSFFEITTAMAFLYFAEKKADIVILETGLGGRLDATNVITPLVAVITGIGKEHTNILGSDIKKIAYEKACIIKNKVPVVTGATGTALSVIKKYAKEKQAPLSLVTDNQIAKKYNRKTNTWIFGFDNYKNLQLKKLKGSFQVKNAALALQTSSILIGKYNYSISDSQVEKGIAKAQWPGRMQQKGNIIFDCAHNEQAFDLLFNELSYYSYNKLILITGFSNDKNVSKLAKRINQYADTIILTQANNKRAAEINKIEKYFSMPILIKNPKEAIVYAKKIANKNDLILTAGSIYLVGYVLWVFGS